MRWTDRALPALLAAPLLTLLGAPLCAAQPGPAGPIDLSQPWATPAPNGGDTSVMFTLHNAGTVPDALIHAECAVAESAELVGPAAAPGGAPGQLAQIVLAPAQTVDFAPDGVRLILHHLLVPVQLGQTLHCTASFAKSGERLFEADVRAAAPPPAPPI